MMKRLTAVQQAEGCLFLWEEDEIINTGLPGGCHKTVLLKNWYLTWLKAIVFKACSVISVTLFAFLSVH